jgi:hypothetical protein
MLYDLIASANTGTTDRSKWFMLRNERTGDTTYIDGVRRGAFRLHAAGSRGVGEGFPSHRSDVMLRLPRVTSNLRLSHRTS